MIGLPQTNNNKHSKLVARSSHGVPIVPKRRKTINKEHLIMSEYIAWKLQEIVMWLFEIFREGSSKLLDSNSWKYHPPWVENLTEADGDHGRPVRGTNSSDTDELHYSLYSPRSWTMLTCCLRKRHYDRELIIVFWQLLSRKFITKFFLNTVINFCYADAFYYSVFNKRI